MSDPNQHPAYSNQDKAQRCSIAQLHIGQWFLKLSVLVLCTALNPTLASEPDALVLDQFAPSSETLARWKQDTLRLAAFDAVAEFANRKITDQDKSTRTELEIACQGVPFPKCRSYIKANRSAILRALPTNPRYWELFWQVTEVPELVDLSFDPSAQMQGYQRLIDASYWWFYIDLAATGTVDIDHAIAIQQASRNWSTGYQSLIARMIGIAIQGITRNQMSFALAQASRRRNRDQLNRLASVLQPTKASELHGALICGSSGSMGSTTCRRTRLYIKDQNSIKRQRCLNHSA